MMTPAVSIRNIERHEYFKSADSSLNVFKYQLLPIVIQSAKKLCSFYGNRSRDSQFQQHQRSELFDQVAHMHITGFDDFGVDAT